MLSKPRLSDIFHSMAGTKNKTRIKRIKPDLPGGFRDYGPADAIARQAILDTIRRTFESFGFDPLETSAVQRTEVLTGGEEDSGKIIFNVRGSQEKESDTALRFDLTVPPADKRLQRGPKAGLALGDDVCFRELRDHNG